MHNRIFLQSSISNCAKGREVSSVMMSCHLGASLIWRGSSFQHSLLYIFKVVSKATHKWMSLERKCRFPLALGLWHFSVAHSSSIQRFKEKPRFGHSPFAEFNLQLLQGPRSFVCDDVMPLGWFFELKKLQYQHSLLYVFNVVSKATRKWMSLGWNCPFSFALGLWLYSVPCSSSVSDSERSLVLIRDLLKEELTAILFSHYQTML